MKSPIWGIPFCGAKTWTLQNINHKFLESSETWSWRRVEKISVTDRVRNEVLRVRNIMHQTKRYASRNKKL
jgi:hypothetical protein